MAFVEVYVMRQEAGKRYLKLYWLSPLRYVKHTSHSQG